MSQKVEDLQVWQKAIQQSVAVYKLTEHFPRQEMYGLTSQLQRAAVSVASNIAEGRGRLNNGEFRQFLGMAQGSNYEVQTQLVIAKELGLGNQDRIQQAQSLNAEVGRMLTAFIATVSAKG
ncbi:four helix bundle protein [Granulicella cerasi]|uniref:Four helix bundle protein n=1 Tax=Granulicella cerasi TaxID=741063 RepID=A0ABW1ZBP1_9BACT|nr:four helix bundle protein [Granulicella cerasi]